MTTTADRVAGIRALADFMESNPDLADQISGKFLACLSYDEDVKAGLARWVRAGLAAGVPVTKRYSDKFAGAVLTFGEITMEPYANREEVCERVVTGTREVIKTVPDPAAPTVTVTEVVEDVEWVCTPLLAAGVSA